MSYTLTFDAKQAAILSLVFGLTVGMTAGFPLGAAYGTPQPSEKTNQDADNSGNGSGGGLVSLDGVELEGEPSKGEKDAPIKVIEYTDYGCPFCAEWSGYDASGRIPIDTMEISDSLEKQYVETGEVEFILKDYPVPGLHPNGPKAHRAANCVYENAEDSYWGFHDALLERRDEWMQSGDNAPEETFRSIAGNLGLNADRIMQCYENSDASEQETDKNNIVSASGRLGTPTFFVGNREKGFVKIEGAQPLRRFEQAIDRVKG